MLIISSRLFCNGRVLVIVRGHTGSIWQPDYFADGATLVQMYTMVLLPIFKV
jgi:hypothetical protein